MSIRDLFRPRPGDSKLELVPRDDETQAEADAPEQVGDEQSWRANPNVRQLPREVREPWATYWREVNAVQRSAREARLTEGRRLPACDEHPQWEPRGFAPKSACPLCIERDGHLDRRPERSEEDARLRVEVEHPNYISVGTPKQEALVDAWRQKQRRAGVVEPGSFEEEQALAEMNDLREEAIARDLGQRGRKPDYVNVFTGQVFYAKRSRRSSRRGSYRPARRVVVGVE